MLNVSQSRSTRTARAIAAHGGASVHHIAFASDDIFATAAAMRARGARFVPISPNYYDDLARASTSRAALLERLRKSGILYDRSAAGEYFCTSTARRFADRFFFEIVQRRRYDGYGALNAPARMASQAHEPTRR